jgi:hypothetical protein
MSIVTYGEFRAMATVVAGGSAFLPNSKAPGFTSVVNAGVGLNNLELAVPLPANESAMTATPRSAVANCSCQTVQLTDIVKQVRTYVGGVLSDAVAFDVVIYYMVMGNNVFAYAPRVTAITPNTGGDGTVITDLAGSGFFAGCTATIGGLPVTSLVFVSSTKLTGVVPSGLTPGVYDVVVTNPPPIGTSSGTSGAGLYTVASALPTVIAIDPIDGTQAGGTFVTIEVTDSTGILSAAVGGLNITGFAILDPTHVTGTTQAHAPGFVDVTVTTAGGTSAPLVGAFEYDQPAAYLWNGAAPIVWDGAHLWVGDSGQYGYDSPYEARIGLLRVFDTSGIAPVLIASVDISSYGPVGAVRSLRLSSDGTKIYACFVNPITGVGRCLILDKTTRAVVGNATVTPGAVGGGGTSQGARDALDDGADRLFVVNTNGSTYNVVERFSLAACLANGVAPTASLATIQTDQHVEEMTFDGTYIWGSPYGKTSEITRITVATDAVSTCNDPLGRGWMALKFVFGELWATEGLLLLDNVFKLDRSAFVPGGSVDMVTLISPDLQLYNRTSALRSLESDGTYLWTAAFNMVWNLVDVDTYYSVGLWGLDPTDLTIKKIINTQVQSRSTSASGEGFYGLAFDGTHLWSTKRYRYYLTGTPNREDSCITKLRTTGIPQAMGFYSGPGHWYQYAVIDSITPSTGPAAGGTVITFTGTGFIGPAGTLAFPNWTDLSIVLGTGNLFSLAVLSDTLATATTLAQPAGVADMRIGGDSTQGGPDKFWSNILPDAWTYTP